MRKSGLALTAVALVSILTGYSVTAENRTDLPAHPRLLITAAELPAIRSRAERCEFARDFLKELKQRGDALLKEPVELPARGGQWFHWYSCPKHGARLRTESPTRHVCPIDSEVFTGYPYDDVVLSTKHQELASAVRDLGLLYQVTGERKWADKAREILLAYGDRYLSYPLHDINGKPRVGGGRVLPQTLDEAVWLIPLAQGTDLIWDRLSAAETEALRTKLFYPAAVDVIQKHKMGIHNIQCWKNSAVGLVGLLYGDSALIADAIDSPHGFRAQIEKGIGADGLWLEGAWSYHFYTMSALQPLVEAAFRCGTDLYGDAYKRMHLAPLEMAMPDGTLPAFNDSRSSTARGNPGYEIALSHWRDPRLAAPVEGSSRRNLQAFLSGVDTLSTVPAEAEASRNYPDSGYAVLRSGPGKEGAWLCLDYGPHGGGHGHPDKNGFVLYSGGRVMADDPGTANYGVPVQSGWYRTTLAHNTLSVDEKSQNPASGNCLDFQTGAGWSGVLADAGSATPGVTFRRAAYLIGKDLAVFLDIVRSTDGQAHTLDLAYHPAGVWDALPEGSPVTLPDLPGYSYLRDVRSIPAKGGFRAGIRSGAEPPSSAAGILWVVFAGDSGADSAFWAGSGVGANTEARVPILIARRKTAGTVFAWVVSLHPSAAPPEIQLVPATGDAGAAAAEVRFGGKRYLAVSNPSGVEVKAGGWTGSSKLVLRALD